MFNRRQFCAVTGAALLAGCARRYLVDGKPVTSVVVNKGKRQLHLLSDAKTLRTYPIALGFTPVGHKQFEGDGKTPEGLYVINRRNPRSAYHLSIGISYPNQQDWQYAQAQGKSPGGDIFVHGTPRRYVGKPDWTAGCVAISNRAMNLVFHAVRDGTPILITA